MTALLLKATLVLALALAAAGLARRARAARRHLALAAAFALLWLLPGAGWLPALHVPIPAAVAAVVVAPAPPPPARVVDEPTGIVIPAPAAPRSPAPRSRSARPGLAAWLGTLWLAGALLCLAPLALAVRQMRRLRRFARPWRLTPAGTPVLLHARAPGPLACGIVRPAIVLPLSAPRGKPADLDRALLHELEHVRRRDALVHLMARAACALYWFHPLVWIAWRRLGLEAERACDDAVVAASPADEYADQLVTLARQLRSAAPPLRLAMAGRGDLAVRVRALLDRGQRRGRAGAAALALTATTAIAALALLGPLQLTARPPRQDAAPRFDSISIKPFVPAGPFAMTYRSDPTYWTWHAATLKSLVSDAYLTDPFTAFYRLKLEGPDWIATAHWDVTARAAAPAGAAQFRAMLQTALRDRFHLVVATETRPVASYWLEAQPGGAKLKPAENTTQCGEVLMVEGRIAADCLTASDLAEALGNVIGDRPVFNHTGLPPQRQYAVELDFGTEKKPDAGPSIFTALRQLGLRLRAANEPVEVYVVKSAEKPKTDN